MRSAIQNETVEIVIQLTGATKYLLLIPADSFALKA